MQQATDVWAYIRERAMTQPAFFAALKVRESTKQDDAALIALLECLEKQVLETREIIQNHLMRKKWRRWKKAERQRGKKLAQESK